ncbi:hypothetical protein RJ641_001308 [Dillenia turbinata]|uniref:Topoisomerase 6 subunit A/Spo11 TOPRIM domain-containing protein n=1 Tax=Dillenia turbinata TaxID=194707 RepID=A0AAN8ZWN6_9MAGN
MFNRIPSILITAKGCPDIATGYHLNSSNPRECQTPQSPNFMIALWTSHLVEPYGRFLLAFPELPILALVHRNPAGLTIPCTFEFGSTGMGIEAYSYASNVKLLGLRGDDLQPIYLESLVPLKPRDPQVAKSLMSGEDHYEEELSLMVKSGLRAEMEAHYFHGHDRKENWPRSPTAIAVSSMTRKRAHIVPKKMGNTDLLRRKASRAASGGIQGSKQNKEHRLG